MEQGLVLRDAMLEIQARVGYSPQISNVWLGHPHAPEVNLQYKDSLEGGRKGQLSNGIDSLEMIWSIDSLVELRSY